MQNFNLPRRSSDNYEKKEVEKHKHIEKSQKNKSFFSCTKNKKQKKSQIRFHAKKIFFSKHKCCNSERRTFNYKKNS